MVNTLDPDFEELEEINPQFQPGRLRFGEVVSVNAENNTLELRDLKEPNLTFKNLNVITVGSYDGGSQALPQAGVLVAWVPFTLRQGIVLGRVMGKGTGDPGATQTHFLSQYPDGKGIRFDRSSNTAQIEATMTEIGESPTEPAVLGTQIQTWLTDLVTSLAASVVTCAAPGVASGPLTPVPPAKDFATLASEIVNILATQVKVK